MCGWHIYSIRCMSTGMSVCVLYTPKRKQKADMYITYMICGWCMYPVYYMYHRHVNVCVICTKKSKKKS